MLLDTVASRTLAVRHLGEGLGNRVADLARPGYRLDLIAEGEPTRGHTRFGGGALLEPGTPWPGADGMPLSLLAVLDLAEFTPLLTDELPPDADGLLLNFFHGTLNAADWRGSWDDPALWRVVPAAVTEAVEVSAPKPAVRFLPTPVRPVPVVTLPDCEEVEMQDLIQGPGSDRFDYDVWVRYSTETRDLTEEDHRLRWPVRGGKHQAFGWPWVLHSSPTADARKQFARRTPDIVVPEDWRLLLQLDSDGIRTDAGFAGWQWGDMGELHFTIPGADLRAGVFDRVEAGEQG
ncbi:DUF1963 domain-containing protein [Streptomyces sp. NPDC048389]|uniref:DUF1963 domain-containing protein n=1 Tax=Streptomyces sp. NPDC048389 TaxID=3154622 RepID=UPI0034539CC6